MKKLNNNNTSAQNENNEIFVSFHIGRGGQFFNGGNLSYFGNYDFSELCNLKSDYIEIENRDEHGRFITPILKSESGHIISTDSIKGSTGTLDFDGDYDTYFSINIEDCNEGEIELILENETDTAIVDYIQCNYPEIYDEYTEE